MALCQVTKPIGSNEAFRTNVSTMHLKMTPVGFEPTLDGFSNH